MARAHDIPDLDAEAPLAETARRAVAVRAEEVFEHATGVLDVSDIERVHAMRVATRRLRAVLEIFAPAFPAGEVRPLLREVKALADALGVRRDPDVAIKALSEFAGKAAAADRPGVLGLVAEFEAEQSGANEYLARALEAIEESDLAGRLQKLAAGDAA
jgi:CHAD domain-containing protein